MDFHVWAKLDIEGHIESVQSSCTLSPQKSSPMLFISTEQLENGTSGFDNAQLEKVVPYVEKKELTYKLDAKVDEMAVIITQMAELSKRVKVQEKLIAQYEENLLANKKKISLLERENAELKDEQKWTRRSRLKSTCSSSKTIKCHGKCGRSLSWPRDSRTLENYSNYPQTGADKSRTFVENVNLNDVESASMQLRQNKNGDDVHDKLNKTQRPSTLSLGFDISSSLSGTDIDFEGHFNFHHQEMLSSNGYSYVKKQELLALQSSGLPEEKETSVENSKTKMDVASVKHDKNKKGLLGQLDNDGYLDMSHSQDLLEDNFYSFGKEVDDHFHNENKQAEDEYKCCVDNEAIHSSWIDIRNGTFIMQQDDTEGQETDDYLEPMGYHHGYVSIPEDKIQDYAERPSKPRPPTSGSDIQDTDLSEEIQSRFPRDRSTSLPNTFVFQSSPKSPRKDGKQSTLEKCRLSNSFELPAKPRRYDRASLFATQNEKISQGTDIRKDDQLNKVFKDMRTTMEWNKAKKKLISKSHQNTIDIVEKRLRSTVQEVYVAFKALQSEQGSRMKKYTKERVLDKIKDKIEKSQADVVMSDEFMKKCLDLVQSTSLHAKTP